MDKKELFKALLVKAVKVLVVLTALFLISCFIGVLPFAKSLPFFTEKLPISVFLNAVISLLALMAFVGFGSETKVLIDGLLERLAGAGDLFSHIVKILALLFAYYAFQEAVFPFIRNFEWVYQSLFLVFTMFFLAKAGLQVYHASEEISRFLLSLFNPYKKSDFI
ncbi:MAG TPA: hypothetical protein DCL44_11130 [Elusimicrobia bacterium]|nr:hypothetical protein [Elusimicrobiota bacterium]